MNGLKNSVTLIGHLGKDPKLTTTPTGKSLLELSMATNERYKNKDGQWITDTEWHRCIAWGKLAEIMNDLCKKGKEVIVRGQLKYNTFEDKDGLRRKIPQVVIAEFALLSKKEAKAEAS